MVYKKFITPIAKDIKSAIDFYVVLSCKSDLFLVHKSVGVGFYSSEKLVIPTDLLF